MVKVNVTVKDRGIEGFMKRVAAAGKGWKIGVGVRGAKESQSRVTNARLANWFESGTKRMVARQWFSLYKRENEERLRRMVLIGMREVIIKGTLAEDAFLKRLGTMIVGEIQKRISMRRLPPNKPSTIARKKSSTPLVDTGQFRASIGYEVEKA